MITSEEPKVSMVGRYSVTETAAKLGIHRNTLLKYTKLGQIRPRLRRSGAKFYSGSEILRFWRNDVMKDCGAHPAPGDAAGGPDVSPGGKYNCSQAAAKLGISRGTLAEYTACGLIGCNMHVTGAKFYHGSEILRFWRERHDGEGL